MMKNTDMFLFYNVYGDADSLVAFAPEHCTLVPFGWTEEVETARNEVLSKLGINVSCLPSLIFWKPEVTLPAHTVMFPDGNIAEISETDQEPGWDELPIGTWPKEDWTWLKIKENLIAYGPVGMNETEVPETSVEPVISEEILALKNPPVVEKTLTIVEEPTEPFIATNPEVAVELAPPSAIEGE